MHGISIRFFHIFSESIRVCEKAINTMNSRGRYTLATAFGSDRFFTFSVRASNGPVYTRQALLVAYAFMLSSVAPYPGSGELNSV